MAKVRRKKEDSTTATMRRFEMLQLIPWEPARISTSDLHRKLIAAGYYVEPRTVQRDLDVFCGMFQYNRQVVGKAHHWFWPRGFQAFSVRAMSPAAALVLAMAECQLQGVLPGSAVDLLRPYFEQARVTLSGPDPRRFAAWRQKVRIISRGPRFQPPAVRAEVQESVFDALLSGRRIRAIYRRRGAPESKESELHPRGLVARDGVLYLIASAWEYPDAFHYPLHRFDAVEVLPEPVSAMREFDLDGYLAGAHGFSYPTGEGPIRMKLEVDEQPALGLLERPLAPDQSADLLANGRYRIEATVEDSAELRWWLLAHGAQIRVTAPAALRRAIASALTAAASHYSDSAC